MSSVRVFLVHMIMMIMPPTRLFLIKRLLLSWAGVRTGQDVKIVSSARFYLSGALVVGDGAWIGHDFLLVGGDAPVTIGPNCDIAPRVTFATGTHEKCYEGPRVAGKGYSLPITIGEGCWICTGATILGGTNIGPRSIVAAGAVVKGEFPAGSLIGGVPACLLRTI